jgi:glycosyltransferase involved in cell wall biosynthesis
LSTNRQLNYEESIMNLDEVLDLLDEAIRGQKPLSLGRYGHLELAYLGWSHFPEWTNSMEPYSSYSGATVSVSRIGDDLTESLKTVDIVGFHTSWGAAWEDRKTAKLTSELLEHINFSPLRVCSAFITHEMIKSDRFWASLKNQKIALVGRRATEACPFFENNGIEITFTSELEGYEDIEKVFQELSDNKDWNIALISAGIPAKILAPRLAQQTNKVVIDFGHAMDKLIDGQNFNYEKILTKWKDTAAKNILVSIVMPVYNGERFLKEALDSALAQTYPNIEIIVVNDGSTDSTQAILDEIDDERVNVIHLEENQGGANALNTGIRQAKGSWIAIHDADDNSYPTKIEEQVKYLLEHPHLVGIGTLAECIPGREDISNDLLLRVAQGKNCDVSRAEIREKIFWGCPLFHSSVIFSKDVFCEIGGYDTEFKIAYDYDLWLKLLEKGEIEKVPKVLLQYRVYKESLSNKDGMATVNEIQVAASKAIQRRISTNKKKQPKIILIGPKPACKNFKRNINPYSRLNIYKLIYHDWKKQISRAVKKLKKGKADVIIVLDSDRKEKDLNRLERQGLKLNQQVFNIYNILT